MASSKRRVRKWVARKRKGRSVSFYASCPEVLGPIFYDAPAYEYPQFGRAIRLVESYDDGTCLYEQTGPVYQMSKDPRFEAQVKQ